MLAAADAAVAAASALALAAAAIGYPFSSSIYRFGERRENAHKVLHNLSQAVCVCLHGCFRCMCNGLVSSTYELRRVLFYRLQ